jgi:inner membrane protein
MAYGMARVAESTAAALFSPPLAAHANPIPGMPAQHRMVLVYDDFYRVIMPDGAITEVPRPKPGEIVQQALASDSIRGFATWMRYPYWEVEETAAGWLVHFRDLRYINPDEPARGFGSARVFVPRFALELDGSALSQ